MGALEETKNHDSDAQRKQVTTNSSEDLEANQNRLSPKSQQLTAMPQLKPTYTHFRDSQIDSVSIKNQELLSKAWRDTKDKLGEFITRLTTKGAKQTTYRINDLLEMLMIA